MLDGRLVSQVIIDILKHEMLLGVDDAWIRDQNRTVPGDKGLYVVVGMVDALPFMNKMSLQEKLVDGVSVPFQVLELQQKERIQIDLFSRSNDALTRNWEVIAAMQSIYAQQQQEKNNIKIFRIPNGFFNTSSSEGGSMLNRYTITLNAFVWYRKETQLNAAGGEYFTDFSTRVDDEDTIGTDKPLIEFEIN